jgi:hypothetical protein
MGRMKRAPWMVVLLLAVAPPASASVVLALDLTELVARADHVVVATALEQRARWHRDGRRIVTDVDLRVSESLKGPSRRGDRLRVTHLGGSVGEVALQVPGEAAFGSGQRVLAFLRRVGDGIVLPAAGDMALVVRADDGSMRSGSGALERPRPLSDVVREVREIVRHQSARH